MNKDVIYIRIDEDLKKKLDMIALDEQRSLNNLARDLQLVNLKIYN